MLSEEELARIRELRDDPFMYPSASCIPKLLNTIEVYKKALELSCVRALDDDALFLLNIEMPQYWLERAQKEPEKC